jgi:hypothetical protein
MTYKNPNWVDPASLKNKFGNIFQGDVTDSNLLKTLYGGGDLIYKGKDYGDIFDDPGKTSVYNKWDDSWQKNRTGWLSKKTWGQNVGGENFLGSMYDLGYKAPTGYFAPEGYSSNAQFSGDDQRYNESYSQTKQRGLGKLVSAALNFIPVVGPFASTVYTGANNKSSWRDNITGQSQKSGGVGLGQAVGSLVGGMVGAGGLADTIGKGAGLTGKAATAFGNAVIAAGTSTAGGMIDGQQFGDALKGGAMAGLGAGGGQLLQGALKGQLASLFGNTTAGNAATNILSRTVGNTSMAGLQQLLSGNKDGNIVGLAALQGAMSGAGGTLGSMFGETPAQRQQYSNLGSKIGNFGGQLIRKNQLANLPRRS